MCGGEGRVGVRGEWRGRSGRAGVMIRSGRRVGSGWDRLARWVWRGVKGETMGEVEAQWGECGE